MATIGLDKAKGGKAVNMAAHSSCMAISSNIPPLIFFCGPLGVTGAAYPARPAEVLYADASFALTLSPGVSGGSLLWYGRADLVCCCKGWRKTL